MAPYRKVRPMPHEKTERNQELVRYQVEHPETTYRELGALFDISAAMAHKIISRTRRRR